jgi:hypothetical protein
VEEERAGHSAAGRVQLPVPQIGIRAGKAPGIRHFDPLGDDLDPNSPTGLGIWARSAARIDETDVTVTEMTDDAQLGLPCSGRIRADPGAVDLQTLERFSSFDKSLITIFVDLDEDFLEPGCPVESNTIQPPGCGVAHTTTEWLFGISQWLNVMQRLLSAVNGSATARVCPKRPLLGPYCRSAVGQGSGGSTGSEVHQPSIPSAGGTT